MASRTERPCQSDSIQSHRRCTAPDSQHSRNDPQIFGCTEKCRIQGNDSLFSGVGHRCGLWATCPKRKPTSPASCMTAGRFELTTNDKSSVDELSRAESAPGSIRPGRGLRSDLIRRERFRWPHLQRRREDPEFRSAEFVRRFRIPAALRPECPAGLGTEPASASLIHELRA